MLSPVTTLRAAMTFVLVMGFATVVRANVYTKPGIEFQRLGINDTPPDRCSPELDDAKASSSSSSADCNLLYSSVPFGGKCYGLLQQGPCSSHHWVVLDKETGLATCQFQVCPNHNVLVTGGCTRLGKAASNRHCPKTLQLIINEYGEAECECPMGRVYHSASRKCYDPYEQGPCEQGSILQVVEKDGKVFADCVPSLCPISGQVPMTSKCELAKFSESTVRDGSYKCYRLSSAGPCLTGFLVVDRTMLDVVCAVNHPYAVYDSLPGGAPCLPGSSRDSMRGCRMIKMQSVSNAVTKAIPTIEPGTFEDGNVCPKDYVFLEGKCLHTQPGH